jgi:hypothetical protein
VRSHAAPALAPLSAHGGPGSPFGPIEPPWPAVDTCRMAKKPEPPIPASWDIYKIATVWLGTVEALDKRAAVEKAAQEFKTEVWRLYAVARR